ncbi:MAG: NTP transferase domain-containing protein [Henriciella sp.]|nr:NTP transferase domain-containing protein [Henriciella sp.]
MIYAGGHGTRLLRIGETRRDKGSIEIAGRPLFAHVAERLAPQGRKLAVIAPEQPEWFSYLPEGTKHIADASGADNRPAGPAGALVEALRAGASITPDALVLTAPIDCPFLPEDLYLRLKEALDASDAGAALVSTHGKLQPVFSLWKASLFERVQNLVEMERIRALHLIATQVNAVEVMAWDELKRPPPFLNINTEYDLLIAQHFANDLSPSVP